MPQFPYGMDNKLTFKGPAFRAQLTVYASNPELPHWYVGASEPPKFAVYSLANTYHPSTSFMMAGEQEYYGENFESAWKAVLATVGQQEIPKKLQRFLKERSK